MGIVSTLVTLPYAPVRGFTALLKVMAQEAEAQRRNPVAVSRELEELDRAAEAGEITPRERDEAQLRVVERLTPAGVEPAPTEGRRRSAGRHRAPRRGG